MSIKAFVLCEYIGPRREFGESKTIHRKGHWVFSKDNDWKRKVPSDVAEVLMDSPEVFIVYDEDIGRSAKIEVGEIEKLKAEIAELKEQLTEKKKPGRPPKDK